MKRFTDTDKWDRPWFRKLPPAYKLLWQYITDKCDVAGIWYVDFELAAFVIGESLAPDEALKLFEKQVTVLGDGSRWFITDFPAFQYGNLQPTNNLHRSVLSRLEAMNLAPGQPQTSPSGGAKVKVRVKDKEVSVSSLGGVGGIEIPADLKENEKEISDWLAYKKQRGESYKSLGLEKLFDVFRAIPPGKRREAVDHSMGRNWSGLFEKKDGGRNGTQATAGYAEAKPGKYAD